MVEELSDYHDDDGVCKYLTGNLCSIYDHRPDICNVDAMYEKRYKSIYSRDEFYELNSYVCKNLMKQKQEHSD